ncbi:aminotransferase class V-fold PLP-dependent enzyme [Lentisphaerota bacterium WC36G]|nr:aminotransferase class V-fold PLP-dependent enzyme [Lentisphaerae bacterium WC36]
MINNSNQMVYLDNAAAMKPDAQVIKFFNDNVFVNYCNQEAIHTAAYDLRTKISEAEQQLINCFSKRNKKKIAHNSVQNSSLKVLWNNSGSSAIATFLSSPFFRNGNIICTNLEHASITESIKNCSQCELRIWKNSLKYQQLQSINSNSELSLFDIETLNSLVDEDSKAVIIHHVHSELGVIENIEKIASAVKKINNNTLVIIDSIQSVGKILINSNFFDENLIDALVISGYKTGSFGGGALVYRDVKPNKMSEFFKFQRSGTHTLGRVNPLEALTLVESVKISLNELGENLKKISSLRDYLFQKLSEIILFNGKKIMFLINKEHCSPYICYFVMPGVQSAVILRMLSAENIMVSSGSACEAETSQMSKTLQAIAVPKDFGFGALRVSFGKSTTFAEVELFVDKLKNCLKNY